MTIPSRVCDHRPVPVSDNEGRGNPNKRTVWSIPTQAYSGAHFATFPEELPRTCILAGTSERGVCADCGAPWTRVTEKQDPNGRLGSQYVEDRYNDLAKGARGVPSGDGRPTTQTLGWQPTCGCTLTCPHHGKEPNERKPSHMPNGRSKTSSTGWTPQRDTPNGWQASCTCGANVIPATVLDPFAGSGTTIGRGPAVGRRGIGLDLNAEYLKLAAKRIGGHLAQWPYSDGTRDDLLEVWAREHTRVEG